MTICCVGEFTLRYDSKPWTHNAERRMTRWERADLVKRWREMFSWLSRQQGVPSCSWLYVEATPYQRLGPLQDVSACHPAVKAAIDGLVDTGVVQDDSGDYVPLIIYRKAVRGEDALELLVSCHEGAHHDVRVDVLGSRRNHDGLPVGTDAGVVGGVRGSNQDS